MEYTFKLLDPMDGSPITYWGSDTLEHSSSAYTALECGNDLIDKFKAYYEPSYKKEIPRPRLFVIDSTEINAFAIYEKTLDEYCIGINYGAFQRISETVEETVDMIMNKSTHLSDDECLIPSGDRKKWIDFTYINAMRFFVAHEYAHILCGHVDKEGAGHFEFAGGLRSRENNLMSQMKEFDADETAMSILCYMNRSSYESLYRMSSNQINEDMRRNNQFLKDAGIPEVIINMEAQKYIDSLIRTSKAKQEAIRRHFKYLMLGVNTVFLTLDTRRLSNLNFIADEKGIPTDCRSGFFFESGLQLIRDVDHPIPALRLDAVIRIMDEYIEALEGKERADDISNDVADYVWEVEFLRAGGDIGKVYANIAYTPTAQDFVKEIEALWQAEKSRFTPYMAQLERLFYENRIVNISDDGVLLYPNNDLTRPAPGKPV